MIPWQTLRRDARFAAGIVTHRPLHALVQVTNRCNMKCSFCDFWPNGVAPRLELTVADYRRVAGEMADLGCFLVSIEGGEPFVRPDLCDIVQALGAHHVAVLYTNGWFVTESNAAALWSAGLAQAGVSIDFPDAERHDAKRKLPGTFARACRAVALLRDAAPQGGKQVHVMSVLMRSNRHDVEALLQLSASLGVGHHLTLLSQKGFRRGGADDRRAGSDPALDAMPDVPMGEELRRLWRKFPHFRVFSSYLERMDTFLGHGDMPTCHAGEQGFNLDHVGNIAPCIEKIDQIAGNVRDAPLATILQRTRGLDEVKRCQDCWTACRGLQDALGQGGRASAWVDMATRMRTW